MTVHRYPFRLLAADYGRAAAGLLVTALPLPWLADNAIAFAVVGALALAFAAFAFSTWLRQVTVITVEPDAISTSALRRARLPWAALETFELRYFSTRRDREKGWMQLKLAGGGRAVSVDSALDGFVEVAGRAAEAAAQRGLDLSPSTRANLHALGIDSRYAAARAH